MSIKVSICIPAYNEENNIATLLSSLQNQRTEDIEITEIIVVSSGSEDGTNAIVEDFTGRDSRIRLITQQTREGKISAINEFLRCATNDVLVLESADTIPAKKTLELLCLPFKNPEVGIAGAHPVPLNKENSLMGYISHLEWRLHDKISRRTPKCGELVAFRKVFPLIPNQTAVDEAWIEYEMTRRHYKKVYVPEALVFNKGPETISDFLKQRRRIACGHLDLDKRTRFSVSTTKLTSTLQAAREVLPEKRFKEWFFFAGALSLEAVARGLGYYDYYIKKERYSVWGMSTTTKVLTSKPMNR